MGKIKINGKEYLYRPYHNPLTLARLREQFRQDPSMKNILINNMTDAFITTHKEIINPLIHHEENTIWNVSGLTGSGKSMTVMSLIKQITPNNFTYKQFVFFDNQVLEMAKQIPRDSFVVRDETIETFGVGSNRIATDVDILSETCRKAGLNLVFISPQEKYISVSKWDLQTIDLDYDNRITRLGLKDPVTKTFLGAVYVKVLPEDDYDWVMYNKAKDELIASIREGKRIGGKTDFKSIAKEMAKQIDCECFRTKRQRQAYLKTELSNLTSGEIDIISVFMEMVIENGEDSIDGKTQD